MSVKSDVIVIGSGVVGNAAAYYLSKKNVGVVVLEGNETIGDGGASRNAGGVRQSGRDKRELPYATYGIRHIWPTLSEELGVDVEYHQGGNLRLGLTEKHMETLKKFAEMANSCGVGVELLNAEQVREKCPYLSEKVVGASWCPTDGHANPLKTTLAFYKKAKELGAKYFTGDPVVSLATEKGKIRRAFTRSGAVYEADRIILAAGYESRILSQTVGIDIPMTRFYEECVVTEMQPPMFDIMLGVATGEVYGHQTEHGSFVFGSDTGLEPTFEYCEGQNKSHPLNMSSNCRAILKYVPCLENAKIVRTWGGWMDISYDRVPVIDAVGEVPGLIIGCGMSGHGFGTGPVVGLILSQLALGEDTVCDLTPLRYDRFHSNF